MNKVINEIWDVQTRGTLIDYKTYTKPKGIIKDMKDNTNGIMLNLIPFHDLKVMSI